MPSRLSQAQALGAIPLDLNAGPDKVAQQIRQATQGRGADVVMELVGRKDALRTGFDLLRPGGVLVSAGVHSEGVPWTLAEGKRDTKARHCSPFLTFPDYANGKPAVR